MQEYFNILDFGAVRGTKCTESIQQALDAASKDGNGTVVVPAGEFITGTINLGGASLYLAKGARLLGSPDREDYASTGYVHNEMGEVFALIYAIDASGTRIYGEGTIDLNGRSFYDRDSRVVPDSEITLSASQVSECTAVYHWRPNQPIFFLRCSGLTINTVTLLDAPCWTVSIVESENVRVGNVTIRNDMVIPNSDGFHFCSSRDVVVSGCNIAAGDDCIAITGITDWSLPSENFIISDCVLRSRSKAISVGYMHSIVRNVTISNCIIIESNRALALMSSPGSGLVENVVVSNVRLDTRIAAGNWWGNGEPVCLMGTFHDVARYRDPIPQRHLGVSIRNIYFQNLVCTGENAIAIIGDGYSVENVRFDQISFSLKDSPNMAVKGRVIDVSPGSQRVELPAEPTWLLVRGARGVSVANATVGSFHGSKPISYITDSIDVAIA